jgi:uncharacterized protein YprB with RNaseH-like and TPR domain
MLSEAVRQRLEALRRGAAGLTECAVRSDGRRREVETSRRAREASQIAASPIDWFESGETVQNGSGEHYLIRLPADRFLRSPQRQYSGELQETQDAGRAAQQIELAALREGLPDDALLLDLETCGFAGSAIFLVGLLRRIGDGLCVELLLARNYAEERAILESFWSRVGRYRVLVTFNGKSFDWPMIRDRTIRHHLTEELPRLTAARGAEDGNRPDSARGRVVVQQPTERTQDRALWPQMVHCDLLHHARRKWRGEVPNCKLQTLERSICGRHRQGDLPGAQIPEAYHRFVRTGQRGQIRSILHHNAVDLITLLDLAQRLTEPKPPGRDRLDSRI